MLRTGSKGRRASGPGRVAGLFAAALLAAALAQPAHALGLARADTGACAPTTCVVVTGDIGGGSAEDFVRFIKEAQVPRGALVVLDTDGGDLVAALKIGGVIRRAQLATAVASFDAHKGELGPATCASACVYVLLGGVDRTVQRGSRVGVHQIYAAEASALSASDAQWLNALVAVHLNKMGASFELLTLAMGAAPSTMRWLAPRELAAYGVVADGPAQRIQASRKTGPGLRDGGAGALPIRVLAAVRGG